MKIFAEWTVSIDRNEGEWPDVWSAGYQRWLRPFRLTLTIRQGWRETEPKLVRATIMGQKRWANSRRLTTMDTWHSTTAWEVDGVVPDWISYYADLAMARIGCVSQ